MVSQVAHADGPFGSTVESSVTSTISGANARIYGAVGFLENVLLPGMQRAPNQLLIMANSNIVQGYSHIPADLDTSCATSLGGAPDSCPLGRLDANAFASAGGWGYQAGPIGLFYAAGWTGSLTGEPGAEIGLPFLSASLMGLGFFNTYTAPFQTGPLKFYDGMSAVVDGSRMSYILGASADVLGFSGRVGFLGSDDGNGVFLNASYAALHLSGSTVIQKELGDLPYTRFGFERTPLFSALVFDDPGSEQEGTQMTTSIYALRLQLPTGGTTAIAPFWSGHVEQYDYPIVADFIAVDAKASLAVVPFVYMQHLGATFHSPGFNGLMLPGADGFGWGVSLGLVHLPEMRFYGLDGGNALTWSLDVRTSMVSLSVAKNDPDMLAKFPQAHGGVNINMSLQLQSWWDDDE